MPELPEVEVVRKQLQRVLPGKIVRSISYEAEKSIAHNAEISRILPGKVITKVERVGKLLVISTNDPDCFVLCHLKMTGQLLYVAENKIAGGGHTLSQGDTKVPHKHTRVKIMFTDGSNLYFNDMRKFGYVRLVTKREKELELKKYGIEPVSRKYTLQVFAELLDGKTTTIKAFLLQQKYLAGLGNIYVDEACFRAGVRPDRRVNMLTLSEKEKLYIACREVLIDSISAGGTTFYSFRGVDNRKGGFKDSLQVFQREGKKCFRCSGEIKKTRVAGRGTHWCAGCQA